jgi:agmatine deiminase
MARPRQTGSQGVTKLMQPPEWAHHKAVWIGFPSHPELWADDLAPAREEVAAFAAALHAGGKGERVLLVAADDEAGAAAQQLAGFAEIVVQPFGDIWLRDTAAIMVGRHRARKFRFNGWGGKYDLPGDDDIGERLAAYHGGIEVGECDWVLEGGAIDGDGTGRVVTTEQCLLNRNRNPGLTRADVEARLHDDLGFTEVLWLGDGLLNDHTDGHVDNLARFVGEGRLALPEAADNDPNWLVYQRAAERARAFPGVELVRVPSPGRIMRDDEIVPASYMNFYIGNAAVVVPQYGAPNDEAAVEAIAALFPTRRVIGQRADHVLTGGGSFHCISQQIPG